LDQFSPEWWLVHLYRRLLNRMPDVLVFEGYYDGKHPLSFVTSKYRDQFGKMLQGVSDNWMALVVDAVEERLHVQGFRMTDQPDGDRDAWAIWQENCLDADSEMLHSTALQTGAAYAMVWYGDDGQPVITVEHPAQVYVAYDPSDRHKRVAAIKAWVDEWTGETRANIYLPDGIYKFISARQVTLDVYQTASGRERALTALGAMWRPLPGDEMVDNPLGEVPIVEFRNRPRMLGEGRSELCDVISVQNQINKLVCDMLIASEFAAFRQRWATGVEIPTDPTTGLELDNFKSAVDRLWHVADPTAKFGDFSETQLGNYVAAIENRVQSLASRTRTPPHYLLGSSGSFPSGESLKATETGLIAKVRSRHRHFGESWETVLRLAFAILDDPRRNATAAETIWVDPESRNEAVHTDSLLKRMALGIPKEQLWSDAGYTQAQITRFHQMLIDEAKERLKNGGVDPVAKATEVTVQKFDPEAAIDLPGARAYAMPGV
jgi:hypothetical protein